MCMGIIKCNSQIIMHLWEKKVLFDRLSHTVVNNTGRKTEQCDTRLKGTGFIGTHSSGAQCKNKAEALMRRCKSQVRNSISLNENLLVSLKCPKML